MTFSNEIFRAFKKGKAEDYILSLIKDTTNLNARKSNGDTFLSWAVNLGYITIVEYLIGQHVNVDVPDKYGVYPLMVAVYAQKNGEKIVEMLIEAGAELDNVYDKKTALMMASKEKKIEIVKILYNAYKHQKIALTIPEKNAIFDLLGYFKK